MQEINLGLVNVRFGSEQTLRHFRSSPLFFRKRALISTFRGMERTRSLRAATRQTQTLGRARTYPRGGHTLACALAFSPQPGAGKDVRGQRRLEIKKSFVE